MHKKAIFLDRDGVINKLVFNPATQEYESPHYVDDLELYAWTISALKKLGETDYLLFLISNQPSFAKGKTSLENIKNIHLKFHDYMEKFNIKFIEYFYCYHHPNGIVKKFSGECKCRKPKPYFLKVAEKKYSIDMNKSWIIGDCDTDILCGQSAGVKTILIKEVCSKNKQGKIKPDYYAENLETAVNIILQKTTD